MVNSLTESIVFVIYLVFMICIGVFFFIRTRQGGEKTYFLGGRQMGPWVTALSAGASDMSAWVLMGLPASVYALGVGQVWIGVGLAIGYALSWIYGRCCSCMPLRCVLPSSCLPPSLTRP